MSFRFSASCRVQRFTPVLCPRAPAEFSLCRLANLFSSDLCSDMPAPFARQIFPKRKVEFRVSCPRLKQNKTRISQEKMHLGSFSKKILRPFNFIYHLKPFLSSASPSQSLPCLLNETTTTLSHSHNPHQNASLPADTLTHLLTRTSTAPPLYQPQLRRIP